MLPRKLCAVLLLVFVVGGLTGCGANGTGRATPTPLPLVVNYENAVFTVEQGPIVSEQRLMGEVVPSKQDELFFRSSGFITRVAAKSGDTVKKGEILAELQVDDIVNQLQQARIDLEVAQSNLAKNKSQHDYDVQKAQSDVVIWQKRLALAQLDLDQSYGANHDRAQLNYDITDQNLKLAEELLKLISADDIAYMEQAVKRSELAVQRLEGLLAERQIIAPYDCVVLRVSVRAGQQLDAFFPAFQVGDPSDLIIRAPYDYDLNTELSKDTEARVSLTSNPDQTYPVEFLPNFLPVSQLQDDQQQQSSFSAVAQFFYFTLPTDLKEQVPVGRQINVTVVLGRKDNVLLLPPAAIREYRNLSFVIVQDGDLRRRVEISKIGLKSDDKWEVDADLKPGDQVLGP